MDQPMQGMASPSPANRQWETQPLLKENDALMGGSDYKYGPDYVHKKTRPRGKKRDLSTNSWTLFFLFLKLTLTPAIVFGFVSIIFMFCYHHMARLIVTIDAFLIVCVLLMSFMMYKSYYAVEAFMYFVFAFALFSGGVFGTSLYVTQLVDYWSYANNRHYTNVAPDEPAGAHADAGVLVFMEGARPDGARSSFYKRNGAKWCVAPITVDSSYADDLSVQSDIQYWATGKDCCGDHDGFNCDAARKRGAHAGIVMTKLSDWDSRLAGLFGQQERHYLEEAVLMTGARFDLTSPKDHLLVRFVDDIEEARLGYYVRAWQTWMKTQFMMGVVWVSCGLVSMIFAREAYKDHFHDALTHTMYNFNRIV